MDEQPNPSDAQKPERARRERLEPWRPAFDKILFAIRRVQRLEDPPAGRR
jgi:hypothetical protein